MIAPPRLSYQPVTTATFAASSTATTAASAIYAVAASNATAVNASADATTTTATTTATTDALIHRMTEPAEAQLATFPYKSLERHRNLGENRNCEPQRFLVHHFHLQKIPELLNAYEHKKRT